MTARSSSSLPAEVQLGWRIVPVLEVDAGTMEASLLEEAEAVAIYKRGRVIVGPDTHDDLHRREVVLHELLHLVFEHAALADHFLEAAERGRGPSEEEFAQRLAPPLLELLRRNPALVAYLTGP